MRIDEREQGDALRHAERSGDPAARFHAAAPERPRREEPEPDAPVVALASRSRTFAIGRRHRFTVRLKPFGAATALRLRVTRLSGGGSDLARGRHHVAAGRTGAPRLTLTRAGRALVARTRRVRVRLHVTATQRNAPDTVRSFAVILKRR